MNDSIRNGEQMLNLLGLTLKGVLPILRKRSLTPLNIHFRATDRVSYAMKSLELKFEWGEDFLPI